MSQPLEQLLIARGLPAEALAAAQALHRDSGGTLETGLLELGLMDEDQLAERISEAVGLPRPPIELIQDVSSELASFLDRSLAEHYGVVPLGLIRRQLALLAPHSLQLADADALSFRLSRPLKVYVGTELQIHELMSQIYGTAVPDRLKALRERLQSGSPPPPPPEAIVEPVPPPSQPAAPVPPFNALTAMSELREQTSRDGAIGVAVAFLRQAFEFVAVFVHREDAMSVFRIAGGEPNDDDLSRAAVPLARPSALRTVTEIQAPYVGPIVPGDPLETSLMRLGRSRLRAVFLYPIVIRDRTVAVVYGDRDGEALAPSQLSEVSLLLSQLGTQLEHILRSRSPARKVTPAPLPPSPPAPLEYEAKWPSSRTRTRPQFAFQPPSPQPLAPEPEVLEQGPFPAPADALGSDPPSPDVSPPESLPLPSPPPDEVPRAVEAPQEVEEFELPVEWVSHEQPPAPAVPERDAVPERWGDTVRAFLSGDAATRALAEARLRQGGAAAAAALAERFPGPLYVFRMSVDELPAPARIGPLVSLFAALGRDSLEELSALADSVGEERRFWATVLLVKLGYPEAIPMLGRRLFDPAPDVASAARQGLWPFRNSPLFAPLAEGLLGELSGADPERIVPAILAVGSFHYIPAVPRLIELLAFRDPALMTATAEALREIARQDFGTHAKRWSTWWQQAQGKDRTLWLVEALELKDRHLRLAALSELTQLTGNDFGYRTDLAPGRQRVSLAHWHEWYRQQSAAGSG